MFLFAPLAALAIPTIGKVASHLVNAFQNSPKQQIKRLEKAGIHKNAFFSMGNTGNVTAPDFGNMSDASTFQSMMHEHKKFQEGSQEPEEYTQTYGWNNQQQWGERQGTFNREGKNLRELERLGGVEDTLASAFRSRNQGDLAGEQAISEGNRRNLMDAQAYNATTGGQLNQEKITSEQVNRVLTQNKIKESELDQAQKVLNIQGTATENEMKEAKLDFQKTINKYQEVREQMAVISDSKQLEIMDAELKNLNQDLLVKASQINLNASQSELNGIRSTLVEAQKDAQIFQLDVSKASNRMLMQEEEMLNAEWTIENAPAKLFHTATRTVRDALQLISNPANAILGADNN